MAVAAAASISKALANNLRRCSVIPSLLLPPPPPSFSFTATAAAAASASAYASAVSPAPETPPASALASQIQEKQKQSGSRWLNLFLFVPGAITFGLGTWQLYRRQEKIKVLEYRNERLGSEPLSGAALTLSEDKLDGLEFRRVACKGIFDEKKSIYVGPRSRSISGVTENGYYVITPLLPVPDKQESVQLPILVNRGWVPCSWRDKALENPPNNEQASSPVSYAVEDKEISSWWRFWSKKQGNIEKQVPPVPPTEVVGVVRGSENPSIFVPANDPNSAQWFYVDVPAMARACGLPENTIYIEDIDENVNPAHPYPIPKDASTLIRSSVMPQDHLNYTLTWYSLSAAVTFMAFKRTKQQTNISTR